MIQRFDVGPRLSEMAVHNGTVYRWNRPIYDVGEQDGGDAGAAEPGALVGDEKLPVGTEAGEQQYQGS